MVESEGRDDGRKDREQGESVQKEKYRKRETYSRDRKKKDKRQEEEQSVRLDRDTLAYYTQQSGLNACFLSNRQTVSNCRKLLK